MNYSVYSRKFKDFFSKLDFKTKALYKYTLLRQQLIQHLAGMVNLQFNQLIFVHN